MSHSPKRMSVLLVGLTHVPIVAMVSTSAAPANSITDAALWLSASSSKVRFAVALVRLVSNTTPSTSTIGEHTV